MRQESPSVAASIDDEEVDVEGLWDLTEMGIFGEGGGKSHPGVEEVGTPNLSSSHNAVVGCLHCREQFRAKSIVGSRGHMHQGASCGKKVSKRVSSCKSERSWQHKRMLAISLARPWMWETSW